MQKTLIGTLLALAAAAACQPAPQPVTPVAPAVGGYTFEERVPAQDGAAAEMIAGTVLILPDTIRVETSSGPCKYLLPTSPSRHDPIGYTCPTYGLMFDRDDPVHRSKYSMTTVVSVNETVCVRYAYDANGRRYCAETGVQLVDRTVSRTGVLRLHPKGT